MASSAPSRPEAPKRQEVWPSRRLSRVPHASCDCDLTCTFRLQAPFPLSPTVSAVTASERMSSRGDRCTGVQDGPSASQFTEHGRLVRMNILLWTEQTIRMIRSPGGDNAVVKIGGVTPTNSTGKATDVLNRSRFKIPEARSKCKQSSWPAPISRRFRRALVACLARGSQQWPW